MFRNGEECAPVVIVQEWNCNLGLWSVGEACKRQEREGRRCFESPSDHPWVTKWPSEKPGETKWASEKLRVTMWPTSKRLVVEVIRQSINPSKHWWQALNIFRWMGPFLEKSKWQYKVDPEKGAFDLRVTRWERMAPSQQGVVGGGRSMSESDLREDEEDEEEDVEERRRRRRGQDRIRGLSYEQLDSLTMPLAPRRPPRTYPPPPGQLTRAPSQATMHMTTVPQVISILPTFFSPLFAFSSWQSHNEPIWERGPPIWHISCTKSSMSTTHFELCIMCFVYAALQAQFLKFSYCKFHQNQSIKDLSHIRLRMFQNLIALPRRSKKGQRGKIFATWSGFLEFYQILLKCSFSKSYSHQMLLLIKLSSNSYSLFVLIKSSLPVPGRETAWQ